MKLETRSFRFFSACTLLFAASAAGWAGDSQKKMTGVVTGIGVGSLSISHGNHVFEFERTDESGPFPSRLRAGDFVTVWYKVDHDGKTYEELRVKRVSPHRGQAGQIVPRTHENAPIIDDRAFYNAGNGLPREVRRPGT